MVLIALGLVVVGLLGWLVADALRADHHRYDVEEESWHAAFDRILAAPLLPGVGGDAAEDTAGAADEPREWRLVPPPATARRPVAGVPVTTRAVPVRPTVRHPFEPPV